MPKLKLTIALTALFFVNNIIIGQSKAVNRDNYRINIQQTTNQINIDGILDEEPWLTAEKISKFQRVTPTDTGYAFSQTEVMLAYDDDNIYVGIVCYDEVPGKRPIESLRRDFSFMRNDNIMVFFDTYNDQTNGFAFGVSASGAQTEGIEYDGNRINYNWDIKWKSAVKSYDDKWVAEFSIPFRSIRYFGGATEWGINFGRLDLKTNEKSAWAPMPRQMNHCDLAYTGTLVWDKPLHETSGIRFSVIPYLTGQVTKNNQIDEDAKWSGNAGFDTKLMLSSSLNLDLTVNPDYSQVEEDRQRTNLDRFELFFPERRQFFLENTDLFADLGNSSARPFFSRRIGLNVPVNAGGRLSGRLGDDWRIGLMNIQTGKEDNIPASNYSVAVLQRQVFSRSSITGFFINKQVTGDYTDSLYNGFDYNRVAGLEYNLANTDNTLTGKAFYHQSFYPGANVDAAATSVSLTYNSQNFRTSLSSSWVGADYIAEVGYIRRSGYFQLTPSLRYTFYPTSKHILSHGPSLSFDVLYNPEFEMTDRSAQLSYSIGFQNRSQLSISLSDEYVLLSRSFDPTNTGGEKLASGSSYNWQRGSISYSSDSRKMFYYTVGTNYGNYYNGTLWSNSASVNYRVQPYGSLAVTATYNSISLPDPYNSAKLVLIGPRLDITFTDKLFLTTLVQYNDQIENINMNIRLQWRFAPVSDLFIVYTANSYTEDFSNKNRGLVVKLSYWFN